MRTRTKKESDSMKINNPIYSAVIVSVSVGLMLSAGCKSRDDAASDDVAKQKKAADIEAKKKTEDDKTPRTSVEKKQERPTRPEIERDAFEKAKVTYTVKLESSQGDVLIDVYESLAPLAAARFKELVESGFYDEARFFRVIKGFVAQAGIAADPKVNAEWRSKRMKDDPVKQSNITGTVSFASAGPDSRTTQFFISYKDNRNLDSMGFAPFGKVRDMAPVLKFYGDYKGGGAPRQPLIQRMGNEYLKKEFPKLDYIKKATIIDSK